MVRNCVRFYAVEVKKLRNYPKFSIEELLGKPVEVCCFLVNYKNVWYESVRVICVFQHNADCQFFDNFDIDLCPKDFASDAILVCKLLNTYSVYTISYDLSGKM